MYLLSFCRCIDHTYSHCTAMSKNSDLCISPRLDGPFGPLFFFMSANLHLNDN